MSYPTYGPELTEAKNKVDMALAHKSVEYQMGYSQGAKDMEKAKQIIIDILVERNQQIRADIIEELTRINKECQPSDKCQNKECVDCIAEQLKEKKNDELQK